MIQAIQHIGLGVSDVDVTREFYERLFGFRFTLSDSTQPFAEMEEMVGSVETMRIAMVMNARGGALLEFFEYKSRQILPYPERAGYGDFGILEMGISVRAIDEVCAGLREKGASFLTPIGELELHGGRRWHYAYLVDPDGRWIQLIEEVEPRDTPAPEPEVLGLTHVGIGVSDVAEAKAFYADVLGFDRQVYSFSGHNSDWDPLSNAPAEVEMVILERTAQGTDGSPLLPSGTVKLVAVPGHQGTHVYAGRCHGDIGCMELALDVTDVEAVFAEVTARGVEPLVPPTHIDMGSGTGGTFAYVRGPDGTVIEFVEITSVAWLSARTFLRFFLPLLRLYCRLFPS